MAYFGIRTFEVYVKLVQISRLSALANLSHQNFDLGDFFFVFILLKKTN